MARAGRDPARADGAEVTVECNPDTVTAELLATYRDGGREPAVVRRAVDGRRTCWRRSAAPTTRPTSSAAVALARGAGFDVVQPRPHLRRRRASRSTTGARTLDAGARARPAARQRLRADGRGRARRSPPTPARHPDDDDQADKYLLADERARAPPGSSGTRSRTGPGPATSAATTSSTGRQGDYRGFGCAAHSHQAGRRWWNVRTPERYIDAVGSGASAEGGVEQLDDETRRVEGLQLALRTAEGVPLDALPDDAGELDHLVERRGDRVSAHGRGSAAGQRGRAAPGVTARSGRPAPAAAANTWPGQHEVGVAGHDQHRRGWPRSRRSR